MELNQKLLFLYAFYAFCNDLAMAFQLFVSIFWLKENINITAFEAKQNGNKIEIKKRSLNDLKLLKVKKK